MGEKKWNIKTGNLINNVLTKSQFGITKRRFEINAVYIYSSLNPLLWPSVRSAAALRNVDENSFPGGSDELAARLVRGVWPS